MKVPADVKVCIDVQRRTCLQVLRSETGGYVQYLQFNPATAICIHKVPMAKFDEKFTPMADYEAEKACKLYLGYAGIVGITPEALGALKKVVKVPASLERALTASAAPVESEPPKRGRK